MDPLVRNRQEAMWKTFAQRASAAPMAPPPEKRSPVGGSSVKSMAAMAASSGAGRDLPLWPGMCIRRGRWAAKARRASYRGVDPTKNASSVEKLV